MQQTTKWGKLLIELVVVIFIIGALTLSSESTELPANASQQERLLN